MPTNLWKWYYIIVRFTENSHVSEFPILRYGQSVADAVKHAYSDVTFAEVLSVREATQFEIAQKNMAFLM